jgi:hypothetical protein
MKTISMLDRVDQDNIPPFGRTISHLSFESGPVALYQSVPNPGSLGISNILVIDFYK